MTVNEILKIEDANTGCINLFKEGIFWRVYQQSVYFFTRHIKELKVLKKYYKVVNREVVYGGFPDTILLQIETLCQSKNLTFEKHNEKHCSISDIDVDHGFEEWFRSIPLQPKADEPLAQDEKGYEQIIDRIKNYPVISKTPLEALQFLSEIQQSLVVSKETVINAQISNG